MLDIIHTLTGDLSDAIVAMADRLSKDRSGTLWGTYHFCGTGSTTWYDFARAIVQQASKRESLRALHLTPIATADYPTPAKRPKWSVLDCIKIERVFGMGRRHWREGLRLMLEEFNNASS